MTREPIVVVGSGPSGVHCAWSLVEAGRNVTLFDVGYAGRDPVRPSDTLDDLKRTLDDPTRYFLGDDFESLILPSSLDEYYGFPPNKQHVFRGTPGFRADARGFSPLYSFAEGGLAEAWTGGSYPFTEEELEAFPFGYDVLGPWYDEVARRIGITGVEDDLVGHFPWHAHIDEPVQLDEHAQRLMDRYGAHRERFVRRGFRMGHARLAVTTRDRDGRGSCERLGRCLWGCPRGALYVPSLTLARLKTHERCTYVAGERVLYYELGGSSRARKVVTRTLDGTRREYAVGTLILAAGTLSSARIHLESLERATGRAHELQGLMDNRQVLLPFVNLDMVGRPFDGRTYQYHQLAIAMQGETAFDGVHGLVTTLKTALVHPIVQSLPLGVRTSAHLFRNLHAALGLVNVNFADRRRETCRVFLRCDEACDEPTLCVEYVPPVGEEARIQRTLKAFRRFLRSLHCIAPKGMAHVRPMGASVHYAGLLPMAAAGDEGTTTSLGISRRHDNVVFADGTTFPSLPAKNLTFTLMANAARIGFELGHHLDG
ncbi:MAG: GMC family oxidoreductase [Planctomycetes bacterium]|nr:GMC family oxidoreductase [Planctomycetota bacterium]